MQWLSRPFIRVSLSHTNTSYRHRTHTVIPPFSSSNTSISQLFAVMRQWVPQTQRNMSSLSREVRHWYLPSLPLFILLLFISHSLPLFSLPSIPPPPSLPPSQVLRRGANVNDRDGLTDLSLLHFACKSGAPGVGNVNAALNLVNSLLNKVLSFIYGREEISEFNWDVLIM